MRQHIPSSILTLAAVIGMGILAALFVLSPALAVLIIVLMLAHIVVHRIYNSLHKDADKFKRTTDLILIFFFIYSAVLFFIMCDTYRFDYMTPIDAVDYGYTPLATKHRLSIWVFGALSLGSMLALWLKGEALPPLTLVLCLVFTIIGIGFSVAIVLQTYQNTEDDNALTWAYFLLPMSYTIIASALVFGLILTDAQTAAHRIYHNPILRTLNRFLSMAYVRPFWVLLLLAPAFILVVAILTLFGQDPHAITKAFTETTTWQFSQQTHPPDLGHGGHYLCTVAVCGNPKVVKPLRLGRRHGNTIVVNRQLLIANAFEEWVHDVSPKWHRIIRSTYDRYGYPLSRQITGSSASNWVYRMMKPLEWFFLVILYLFCVKPEEKIAKQYPM